MGCGASTPGSSMLAGPVVENMAHKHPAPNRDDSNIVFTPSKDASPQVDAIASTRDPRVIIKIMRENVDDGDVQGRGCQGLRESAQNIETRAAVAEAGAIDAVVRAMRSHITHWAVQVHGCGALRKIATTKDAKDEVASAGGLDAVVQGMKAHQENVAVQEWGCRALAVLLWSNEPIQEAAKHAGVVAALELAVVTHGKTSDAVAQWGVLALEKMGSTF